MAQQPNQPFGTNEDHFDPVFCVRCHKQMPHDAVNANGLCAVCEQEIRSASPTTATKRRTSTWLGWLLIPFGCIICGGVAGVVGAWWYSGADDPSVGATIASAVGVGAFLLGGVWRPLRRPFALVAVLAAILLALEFTPLAAKALPQHYLGRPTTFFDIVLFAAIPAYYFGRLLNPRVVSDLVE